MGEIVDLVDKTKRYFKFTPNEVSSTVVTILVIAFIISFKEWGGTEPSLSIGARNLFNAILIVTVSFLVHLSVQRIAALQAGYRAEYRLFTFGLLFGVIIAFVTNGRVWLLLPGGILIHHMAGHRLGWWRYGLNYFGQGMIALMGPIASMLLALFFRMMSGFSSSPLIHKAILFNVAFAIYTMLPIPPLDGSRTFWGSRLAYVFSYLSIIGAALLLLSKLPGWIVIFGALLIGAIGWLAYYVFFERINYKGP